uniref:Uncharacterized protein n=1 Tax=Trypanosoma vivax (strain Y486) TaxID=1055687 RepID=G0U6C4_TRYVY|nr:hypothetical protein TVY486_1004790 [Trypanosoma vivax Y486]
MLCIQARVHCYRSAAAYLSALVFVCPPARQSLAPPPQGFFFYCFLLCFLFPQVYLPALSHYYLERALGFPHVRQPIKEAVQIREMAIVKSYRWAAFLLSVLLSPHRSCFFPLLIIIFVKGVLFVFIFLLVPSARTQPLQHQTQFLFPFNSLF